LLAEDKALFFMRWIRRQLEAIEQAKEAEEHGLSKSSSIAAG
jgi:hypothetical protein